MLIEKEQLKAAEQLGLSPVFEPVVDFFGEVRRDVLRPLGARLKAGKLGERDAAAKVSLESVGKVDEPLAELILFGFVGVDARFAP